MNTELHGPQAGNCAEQFLVVGGDIWPTGFDKICGVNPDQHFYVHLDKDVGSSFVVAFSFRIKLS